MPELAFDCVNCGFTGTATVRPDSFGTLPEATSLTCPRCGQVGGTDIVGHSVRRAVTALVLFAAGAVSAAFAGGTLAPILVFAGLAGAGGVVITARSRTSTADQLVEKFEARAALPVAVLHKRLPPGD